MHLTKQMTLTRISESAKFVMNTFVTVCMALLRQTTTRRNVCQPWKKEKRINLNTYERQVHFQRYQKRRLKDRVR